MGAFTAQWSSLAPILDAMHEGLQIISPDWYYLYLNHAAATHGRRSREELVGQTMMSCYPGIEHTEVFDKFRVCMETAEPQQMLNPFTYPDGRLGWFDLNIYRIPDGIVILSLDVTNRHELARSNEALEQFAYIASHDLQEPLRMVSSYVQLLQRRYADRLDNDARDFIAFAMDGAKRAQALIHDLLAYSRLRRVEKPQVVVDLKDVFQRVLSDLTLTIRDAEAEVQIGTLPTIIGEPGQLAQLFQNLISNALKFRKPGIKPIIDIGASCQDGKWSIWIRDNGIGIEEQYQSRIFQIFQRLHTRVEYPGNGIGLAICKRIVEQHQGTLTVESAPEMGSTFWLTIPDRVPKS